MRTKLDRFFGKCRVKGCAYRRVTNDTHINGESIFYRGSNRAALREIGVQNVGAAMTRQALWHIAAGFWATRVDCGLTSEEEAVKRLADQLRQIDRMFARG